jgi:hypothetical protein
MNRIIIDSTENKETIIKLEMDSFTDEIREAPKPRTQNTLMLVEKILKKII